jgi:Haem-NO-binding
MKGIVFTEFLDMVSDRYGEKLVDDIIEDAHLPHGGAYTSVGTYPHAEMVTLVDAMSQRTGVNLEALLEIFGHHLFGRFYVRYPAFMDSTPDALDFLMGIETIVHTEVRKLYPDAQLPQFETRRVSDHQIKMHYHSVHDFSALAVGLIKGCAQHYKCELQIQKSPAVKLSHGVSVDFVVSRND